MRGRAVTYLDVPRLAQRVHRPLAVDRASARAADRDAALVGAAQTVELAAFLARVDRQLLPVTSHNTHSDVT